MKQDPKMKQPSPISRTQCQLRVDGIVNPRISFRLSFDEPDDFDIVVDDAFLGSLAITTDCILEIRGMGADWRTCTLDELKSMVVNDSESLVADDFPSASEIMEKRIVDRLDDIGAAHRPSGRLADLTGHSQCRKRVEALLDQADLPYRSAGTVFLVSDLRKARMVLCRHGFYPSPISQAALVEPESRCAVQLIERASDVG